MIKATDLPAVVTLAIHQKPTTREGLTPEEACRRLKEAGADVVGLNCIRGPRTLLPLIEAIRARWRGPSPLPVPRRTREDQPSFLGVDPTLKQENREYAREL